MTRSFAITLIIIGGVAAIPESAHACGVIRFGDVVAAAADGLQTHDEPVIQPDVIAGASIHGTYTISGGLLWGQKETGFLAASSYSRVLFDAHLATQRSYAITYGKYIELSGWGFGLDGGGQVDAHGAGPATRVQFGCGGLALRWSGAIMFEEQPRFEGRAELIVDFASVVGALSS
jgi:hypothetical protein